MKSVRFVAIVGRRHTTCTGRCNGHGAHVPAARVFGTFDDLVFGGILLAMMLFAPEGIVGGDLWRRLKSAVARPAR
jgi:ABC-type branched-subunit amino acid transport system permease subunit